MPTKVPIEIFCIGHTVVDKDAVKRWLEFVGVSSPTDILDNANNADLSNPALLIALAGKRCYKSFEPGLNPNVSKIRADYGDYFDNILKSGHGSVLEHSVYTFAFENVSRVFTGEMNRHRAGWAISEGSMRFIRFGENVPYWEPTCIQGPDVLDAQQELVVEMMCYGNTPSAIGLDLKNIDDKKHATRLAFECAFSQQQSVYRLMEQIWADELAPTSKFHAKKQITSMMRRIIGMGCATGGVWTGNVRALRHVITMRASPEAEEEILHVFSRVAKMMRDREPLLFGDFEERDGFWIPKYKKV